MQEQWIFTEAEYNSFLLSTHQNRKDDLLERRKYVKFIQDLGQKLSLPQPTISAAFVLLHRFYMRKSFCSVAGLDMSIAALFTAGKACDTPCKLNEIISQSFKLRSKEVSEDSYAFEEAKANVSYCEVQLLETLCFDVAMEKPYQKILDVTNGYMEKREVAQLSWLLLNDSFNDLFCLYYSLDLIATACVVIALLWMQIDCCPLEKIYKESGMSEESVVEVVDKLIDFHTEAALLTFQSQ